MVKTLMERVSKVPSAEAAEEEEIALIVEGHDLAALELRHGRKECLE